MKMQESSLGSPGKIDTATRPSMQPPQMTILADHPAASSTAAPDLLGLESRLAVVFDILRHKETNCPITIGVYGDWGTGKTSAMRWLEAELKAWNQKNEEERGGHPRVYPVWFDPWKYHSREDVWRGIIAEVILALFFVSSLDRQNLVPRMTQAAKKFGAFLGKSFLHALAAIEVKAKADAVGAGGEVSIKGEMFRDIYDEFQTTNRPEKPFLNEFERTLQEWVGGFLEQHGDAYTERIVLFIDDLDRCLPEVTLEVLEAIKLYLNIQPLAFVVGVDRTVVDSLVAKHYDDNGLDRRKSQQFLDKIFQVEIQIPPSEAQMQGFLDSQIAAIDTSSGGYWTRMLGLTAYRTALEEAIRHLAQYNPRETKRLLNSTLLRGRAAVDHPELREKVKDHQLLFAQGVQFFLVQRFVRSKMSATNRLLLTTRGLKWFEHLSAILRKYPDFEPPDRAIASGEVKSSSPNQKESGSEPATLYRELQENKPVDDEGRPVDVILLEDPILWNLLKIPFSAEVAQSASALEVRPTQNEPPVAGKLGERKGLMATLPSTIRNRIAHATNKTVDQLLPTDVSEVTELNLRKLEISDQDIDYLDLLPSLKSLFLDDTKITDAAIEAIAKKAPTLKALYLGGTNITDKGVATLHRLQYLDTLRLDDTKVTLNAVRLIPESVTLLWLGGENVDDEWLLELSSRQELEALHLMGAKVTGAGLRHIVKFSTLWSLDLDHTDIGDEALDHVNKLEKLAMLYLGWTQISDAGLEKLTVLTKLVHLAINNTVITDKGLKTLLKVPSLRRVDLHETKTSEKGRVDFFEELQSRTKKGEQSQGVPGEWGEWEESVLESRQFQR
jgi:Leucine-rich repeat (LRR) protein